MLDEFVVPVPIEPTDPDVDLDVPSQRVEPQAPVVGAVAIGGVLGALARYGIGHAWPTAPGGFPWGTFVINVSGCLLIGALMVVITELVVAHYLVRPFLGVGVLGGYTTFSTYAVDIRNLIADGEPGVAAGYLLGTLAAALVAVYAGMRLARLVGRR